MAGIGNGTVRSNVRSKVKRQNDWLQNRRGTVQRRKLEPLKCLFNFLKGYCYRSSLHGLRYIVEPGAHWFERLVWSVLFILCLICSIWVILKLATRYQTAVTSTVVESTNYPVSELSFPSVTLCPSNRVNWQKALEMEKRIVPADDLQAVEIYRKLITSLSTITFGDFDELNYLSNSSLEAFRGTILDTNLTNFLRSIAPTCSELLFSCWWRNSNKNCCELFEQQRTEYGFCYSFNSETADFDKDVYAREPRPRRTNTMGGWSGIRLIVNMNKAIQPPESNKAIGVTLFVDDPHAWPSTGRDTGLGKLANVGVQCQSSYATARVFDLNVNKLPCRVEDSNNYNQEFCMTLCRQKKTVERCGCNPTFLMPTSLDRECNLKDLLCLAAENGPLNNYILRGNPYFPENDSGMNCDCPAQCKNYYYSYQITHTDLRESISANTIFIDVHFDSYTMMRYRMDVVYTQLDLLVSFGGVIGLFLGGSILSLMELLYHLTFGLFSQKFRRSKATQVLVEEFKYSRNNNERKHPALVVYKGFPLTDYYPNPQVMAESRMGSKLRIRSSYLASKTAHWLHCKSKHRLTFYTDDGLFFSPFQ